MKHIIQSLIFIFLHFDKSFSLIHLDLSQDGGNLRIVSSRETELFAAHPKIFHPKIIGSPEFYSITNFSLSYKASRLAPCSNCNTFLIPPSASFDEIASIMTTSGFMFTENGWFIVIRDQTPTSLEVWKKFETGIDDNTDFPPIYSKLLFISRDTVVANCYCWLCGKNERFHKLPWIQIYVHYRELDAFHKTLNWAGRGHVVNVVAASAQYQTHDSPSTNCLRENVAEMRTCNVVNSLFTITWGRLNVTARRVGDRGSAEDFDHTLYFTIDDTGDGLDPFAVTTNFISAIGKSDVIHFVYCKALTNFIRPDWKVLFLPLDLVTWCLLLASGVAVMGVGYLR